MPYTIYDSIRDEIEFLELAMEMAEDGEKHTISAAIAAYMQCSLIRILRRVDSGYDYDIVRDKVTGKPEFKYIRTNRKTLEQEYPALKKAAEQYQLIHDIVDSTPKD